MAYSFRGRRMSIRETQEKLMEKSEMTREWRAVSAQLPILSYQITNQSLVLVSTLLGPVLFPPPSLQLRKQLNESKQLGLSTVVSLCVHTTHPFKFQRERPFLTCLRLLFLMPSAEHQQQPQSLSIKILTDENHSPMLDWCHNGWSSIGQPTSFGRSASFGQSPVLRYHVLADDLMSSCIRQNVDFKKKVLIMLSTSSLSFCRPTNSLCLDQYWSVHVELWCNDRRQENNNRRRGPTHLSQLVRKKKILTFFPCFFHINSYFGCSWRRAKHSMTWHSNHRRPRPWICDYLIQSFLRSSVRPSVRLSVRSTFSLANRRHHSKRE